MEAWEENGSARRWPPLLPSFLRVQILRSCVWAHVNVSWSSPHLRLTQDEDSQAASLFVEETCGATRQQDRRSISNCFGLRLICLCMWSWGLCDIWPRSRIEAGHGAATPSWSVSCGNYSFKICGFEG